MTEAEQHSREDDRNDEIEEPPAPDPEEKQLPSEDDPQAD